MKTDTDYLKRAFELASQSDEPVKCGAVLVSEAGEVIAEALNSQRADGMAAAHAEMKAIAVANAKLGRKLNGVTAYGNCEPCTMCLTAFIHANVKRVVFAERLNDSVEPERRINIDCFEFVKAFPKAPELVHVPINADLSR